MKDDLVISLFLQCFGSTLRIMQISRKNVGWPSYFSIFAVFWEHITDNANYSIAPRIPPGQGQGIAKSLTFIETSSLRHLQRQKIGRKIYKNRCVGVLEPPNPAKIEPQVTQVGPKIDKNDSRDPLGAQVASRTAPGPTGSFGVPPFFDFSGRTWSLQGSIFGKSGFWRGPRNRHFEHKST